MDDLSLLGPWVESPGKTGGAYGSYPFLNHSTATLPNNLPPNADDKSLMRQKRKRTSPEDQAILETAYNRDPKPDKAARLELVEQVALGEKEVQIWFQNRRQSSRRKSRPLLPHEIARYQQSRQSPEPPFGSQDEMSGERVTTRDPEFSHRSECDPTEPSIAVKELHAPDAGSHLVEDTPDSTQPATSQNDDWQSGQTDVVAPGQPKLDIAASSHSQDNDALIGQSVVASLPPSTSRSSAGARTLKKASSVVRLSMSFDGNATVVTRDETSPSPQRAPPIPLMPESSSDGRERRPAAIDPSIHHTARNGLQRSASGRSRDSRAWEFWCDRDARSELEVKAEKDTCGSAVNAIGLLRSAPGRTILGSMSNRRTPALFRPSSDAKRLKVDSKTPALRRHNTSFGQLQGTSLATKPRPKLKYSESAVSVYIPGNDSDKENWSPRSVTAINRTAGDQHRATQSASGANPKSSVDVTQRAQGEDLVKTPRMRLSEGENVDPEADVELAAFMRGGGKSDSLSSDDDLDCVQGLLSLSQGNWR